MSSVYVIDCTIFDYKMVPLLNTSANMCAFLSNGSVVKYTERDGETDISLIDTMGRIIWTQSYVVHHTMKVSPDQKRLYFLTMEIKAYQGQDIKFDKVVALDIESGKEIHSWDVYSLKEKLALDYQLPIPMRLGVAYNKQNKKHGEITWEFTHFNSINFIPPDLDGFLNEEIIVNSGRGFVLFFNRDLTLSRLFWVDPLWAVNTHDAQITEDGHLLIYKNWDHTTKNSSLEIIHLETHELLWKYERDPDERVFKADKFGSVQLLEENQFLYTDMERGGHFTLVESIGDKKKKVADFFHPQIDPRNNLPQSFHTIRLVSYDRLSQEVKEALSGTLSEFWFKDLYLSLLSK